MRYLVFFIVVINLNACAQYKDKEIKNMYDINKHIYPEARDITTDNYVKKLYDKIKHYTKEPIYYLRINKHNCLVEIYVNDVLEHKDYELSNYVTPIEIAGKILKSGEQILTVRMYPVENLINESFGREGNPILELLDDSSVNIKVVQIDNRSQKKLADEVEVLSHASPTKEGKFIGAGKTYYEYNFTFNAEVPYEFEGWSNGQDLRKFDKQTLTKQAIRFYTMVQKILVNKDFEAWLKLQFLSDVRFMGAAYVDKKYLDELFAEYNKEVHRNYEMIPIKEYELEFRGEGRLVVLKHTNPDTFYRGKLAAELEYTDEDGYLSGYFPGITLYLPKGRRLEDGLMMWK